MTLQPHTYDDRNWIELGPDRAIPAAPKVDARYRKDIIVYNRNPADLYWARRGDIPSPYDIIAWRPATGLR